MTRRTLVNALLVLAVVALFAAPLLVDDGTAAYGGTDAAVTDQLEADGYAPWFDSPFVPTGEVESGLFALQAALGGGVLGYVLGRLRGRRTATPVATRSTGTAPTGTAPTGTAATGTAPTGTAPTAGAPTDPGRP